MVLSSEMVFPHAVDSVRDGVFSRIQWATRDGEGKQEQQVVMVITSRAGGVFTVNPDDPSHIFGRFLPQSQNKLRKDSNTGYAHFVGVSSPSSRKYCVPWRGDGESSSLNKAISFEGQARLDNIFVALAICRDSRLWKSPPCPKVDGKETPVLFVWLNLKAHLGPPDKIIPITPQGGKKWKAALHVDLGTVARGESEYMVACVSNGFQNLKSSTFHKYNGMAALTIAQKKMENHHMIDLENYQGRSSTEQFPSVLTEGDFQPMDTIKIFEINLRDELKPDFPFLPAVPEGTLILPRPNKEGGNLHLYTAGVNSKNFVGVEVQIDADGMVQGFGCPQIVGSNVKQQVGRSFINNEGKTIIVTSNFSGKGSCMMYTPRERGQKRSSERSDLESEPLMYLGEARQGKKKLSSGANRIILFRVPIIYPSPSMGDHHQHYRTYAVVPHKHPAMVVVYEVTSREEGPKEVAKKKISGAVIYALEVVPTNNSKQKVNAKDGLAPLHTFEADPSSGKVTFNVLAPKFGTKEMLVIPFEIPTSKETWAEDEKKETEKRESVRKEKPGQNIAEVRRVRL